MTKRVSYKDLYNMRKKAGILDDIKAGAGRAVDAIGKQWNKNPYLRVGTGALAGAGLGGLVGGKTGAGIGAVIGGTGGYFAHGDEQVEPGFWDKYGTPIATGGTAVGATGVTLLLAKLLAGRRKRLTYTSPLLLEAGKSTPLLGPGRASSAFKAPTSNIPIIPGGSQALSLPAPKLLPAPSEIVEPASNGVSHFVKNMTNAQKRQYVRRISKSKNINRDKALFDALGNGKKGGRLTPQQRRLLNVRKYKEQR